MLCANTAILTINGSDRGDACFWRAMLDAGVVKQGIMPVTELACGEVAL